MTSVISHLPDFMPPVSAPQPENEVVITVEAAPSNSGMEENEANTTLIDGLSGKYYATERYIGETQSVFFPLAITCGKNGCTNIMYPAIRIERRNRIYYRCNGSDISPHQPRRVTSTKGSFFYKRKLPIDVTYRTIANYLMGLDSTNSWNAYKNGLCSITTSQIIEDLNALMLSDYTTYELPHLLGTSEGCDHIQIDVSKFGKKKRHQGHYIEGVWVFGMVEAILTGFEDKEYDGVWHRKPVFKAGKMFACTVPNRTRQTLQPIIERHCAPNTIIRSDDWHAYAHMHPIDVLSKDEKTYINNAALYEQGDYHFRLHQVVGIASEDQVKGNQTPGYIDNNVIKGIWKDMKTQIPPCFRNDKRCHKKILEFLWRRENPKYLDSINRALREVEMDSDPIDDDGDSDVDVKYFTQGKNGLTPEEEEAYQARLIVLRSRSRRQKRRKIATTSTTFNADNQDEISSSEDSDWETWGGPDAPRSVRPIIVRKKRIPIPAPALTDDGSSTDESGNNDEIVNNDESGNNDDASFSTKKMTTRSQSRRPHDLSCTPKPNPNAKKRGRPRKEITATTAIVPVVRRPVGRPKGTKTLYYYSDDESSTVSSASTPLSKARPTRNSSKD